MSPNASQYLPSLSVICESLANRHIRMGERHADSALLPLLVTAANQECSSVAAAQDFLPHDPRFDVRVEWGGEIFRVVAGALERPTAVIDMLRRLAKTIDPVLTEHARYRLTDIVELILRRVDVVAGVLAPTWPSDVDQELGSVPQVRPEEVAAAAQLPALEDQVAECRDADRAWAALEAHSVLSKRLRRDPSPTALTFGSTIAVRRGSHGFIPLPAGLMVEALPALAEELAAKALRVDASLNQKWLQIAWEVVGRMFAGTGSDVIGPLHDDRYSYLHSVVRYNDSQYLAVSVAGGLDQTALRGTTAAAAGCLEEIRPGVTLRTTRGTESIPPSARLVRLLIIAAPLAQLLLTSQRGSKSARITLQDLDWILRTIGRERIDLWYFVRDLVKQRRIEHIFSWDGMDVWEAWRGQGKSLYRGASDQGILYVEPHSLVEWRKAADESEIELALHILGMGRVSNWPLHDLEGSSKLIGNVLSGALYQLVVCATPVAVSLVACSGTEPAPRLAKDLGECIAYKLEGAKAQFVELMQSRGLRSLRMEFAFHNPAQNQPLWIASFDDAVLTFGCSAILQERLQEDSQSVEALFGSLLAEAIGVGIKTADFVAAWNDSPPGIRFDLISVGPQIRHTPEAVSLHAAHRSTRLTELGVHLQEADVPAGCFSGNDAKRIETDIVHPWLTTKLREQLSELDMMATLGYALTQLESTNCQRWWQITKTAYEVGSPSSDDGRLPASSQDLLRHSRALSLLIEAILAWPPTGTRPPTAYDWQELLSLATLASESGNRSEALHFELLDSVLVISDVYEVSTTESDLIAYVDVGSFERDRILVALPDSVPIGTRNDRHESNPEWTAIGILMPDYQAIEQALQYSLGFGIDAILGTLDTAIRWPVSSPRCTDLVLPERIAAEAHATNPAIPLDSYTRAVTWLSLCTEDFDPAEPTIEHWKIEQRSARIDTRPFARTKKEVWVSPWTAMIAKRIWVNYLDLHRMPRPDAELPQPVVTALNKARQTRQREFEKECASRLDGLPLHTTVRVLEHHAQRHGIQNLSGEVDILCIDPDRSAIFVIEAKDPFVPLSVRSIHRQIARFHEPQGYVDKLTKKVEDIRESAVSLAANKGVEPSDREWQIIGIMVTRHVTPAAYLRTCHTTFCTVGTLRETILGVVS